MKKRTTKKMHDLTWARTLIVSRGMSYQKNGYVRDLAITRSGSLLAWVRGSEN